MEQYDGSKHCCGSRSTAGTWSHPYPSIAWCDWCDTLVKVDKKGMFIIHPRSVPESTFTEEVIPLPYDDPGYCNGCGKLLGSDAKRGLCVSCQIDQEWHWDNSPLTTIFRWVAAQFSRLTSRTRTTP